MPEVFEVEGWEAFQDALARQPEVAVPIIVDSMDKVGSIVTGRVKAIPPAGPGNQKGRLDSNGQPMGFYERGRGWWYPVKGQKTLGEKPLKSRGTQGAPKALEKAIAGYKLAKGKNGNPGTSEQLSRSFSWTPPAPSGDGSSIDVTVGNNASYTKEVTGPHTDQAKRMAAIGWVSIDDAVANSRDDIDAICQEALNRLATDFGGNQ
jgi:hypothetical protein